jgi:hypothetical protein
MAIAYPDAVLDSMDSRYSKLQPVVPGDVCCHCFKDCDEDGFTSAMESSTCYAHRINGHPICARASCYRAKWEEFCGRRSGCGCLLKKR